ncbi:hypothetical protein BsWGS_06680 [Bradybaena similaris]
MWFSFFTVFSLFVFTHGYSSKPRNDPGNIEAQLDTLQARINILLERQETQKFRINNLIGNTIRNRAFQYDYEEVASEDVSNEIRIQNSRLECLARQIAQAEGLKANVDRLQQQAEEVREVLNQTNTRDVNTQDSINEIKCPDAEEIAADAAAASRIQQDLEVIVQRVENSSRILDTLEFRTAQIITTLDFNTAESSYRNLLLTSGTASVDIEYPGFARDFSVYVTGFEFARAGGNYPGTTGPGFEITADFVDNLRVNAYDLSTNGWSTKSLSFVSFANKLQEKRLDIRYPFSG